MQREQPANELPIPALLILLLESGVWPADQAATNRQNLHPLLPPEQVRQFAPEENHLVLYPPPFVTVARELTYNRQFWDEYGALSQIVPEKALMIGDFGLGSDTAIILDYAADAARPSVRRLRWTPDRKNGWALVAESFEEFATILGLTGGVA